MKKLKLKQPNTVFVYNKTNISALEVQFIKNK